MTTPFDTPEIDRHLRRTLAAVAATVQERPGRVPTPGPPRSPGHRRLLVGVGVTIAAIPLVAAAVVRFGPEYVDQIPPDDPIVSGNLDGARYWVVDGRATPGCEGFPSGVELIAEERNVVGQEWNTVGAFFGEPTREGCAPQRAEGPLEHTYYSDGGLVVGDGMVWMGALHPDIDQVRVAFDEDEPFNAEIFEHERGSYYVVEVPPSAATFTVEYLANGALVMPPDGENAAHVVPGR